MQPGADGDRSAGEALYGLPLTVPGAVLNTPDLPPASLGQFVKRAGVCLPPRPVKPEPTFLKPDMQFAYVRLHTTTPLQPRYAGPYKVLKQTRNTVHLKMGDKVESINTSRIKPYLGKHAPSDVAVPPRRGRPRRKI